MIRVIIVDDEPNAREGLSLLLGQHKEIEIIAQCENGISAIRDIDALKPDLVFLDIQMPKVNGFEVLNSINYKIPYVVFVTAYDQYAVKAFEINAQDYLLKPFTDERFQAVLDLAIQNLQANNNQSELIEKLVNSYISNQRKNEDVDQLIKPVPGWNKMTIKNKGRIVFVDYADIIWIEGYDYCVKVHTSTKTHVVRVTLKEMEKKLDAHRFLRISKSALVNMEYVSEIQSFGKNDLLVVMKDQTQIKVSRNYKSNLEKYI
ncbi:MAG: response regulator [Saprospiraceae bacterium]|nr:response regulator [Saprospiraceae bacterium]